MKRCQTCNIIGSDNQTACYADGQPLVDDPLATSLQDAIGQKYALTKLIGKGAMGAVYRAHHRDLGDVAIKVMLAEGDSQTLSERFLREARALRKLRHQNAVLIYDLDRSPSGVTYMVMEMVAGRSLGADLRERRRFNLDETMEVAEAVCDALSAAHERGIIHRDLKPDNILRAEEKGVDGHIIRTIKIADFGIVKQRHGDDEVSLKLTKVGRPIGTPFYMSPEQWFGDGPGITALDHRTDIYALGCTLYELLAGRPPFVGRTTTEMRSQHLHDEPPPLHVVAPQVPLPVSRVIMRALAKDRDERQQTATQFLTELRAAYDENFQNTEQKITQQLHITQESEAEAGEGGAARPSSLIDTEESVPMFLEKVSVLNPELLRIEPQPEAAPEQPVVAAESEAPPVDEPTEALPLFEEMPVAAPDGATTLHDWQPFESQPTPPVAPPVATRSRRRLFVITAIVLLLAGAAVAAGLGLYLRSTRRKSVVSPGMSLPSVQFKPPQIPMSALVGTLRVNAPAGSEVFVDDEKAGVTGSDGLFNMEVPVGVRNVRVAAKGYRLWLKDAPVKANQKTMLNAARERPAEVEAGTTEELEKRAVEASAKKDYETAEAVYRQLLKDDPDNLAAHSQLATILNQEQRYTEAIEEFETVARLDPKDIDARQSLVRLYLLKGNDDEAETTARQLVRLAPREAVAHHWLARALLRNEGMLDEALSEIEAALKIRETPELLETKAYILLARNELNDALAAATRAVELDKSKNSPANAAVAAVLFRMERVDEAVATYKQLRQSEKTDRWGDIKRLELQRGYSKPVLETLAALIARTN